MNHILKRLGTGLVAACLMASSVLAAEITPSVSKIRLDSQENTLSFDLTLKTDEAFAGAEFGIKPSASDVTLRSLTYLEDTKGESTVKTVKDGVLYFGFFAPENRYQAGTYRVARLTYTYEGSGDRSISLDSSKIVTVDENTNQTVGDTSSAPFTVQITRVSPEEGGSGGGGAGGGGGGGGATLPVKPSEPSEVKPVVPPAAPIFTDVHPQDYFYDAVNWAVKQGITQGLTETTFAPNASCTRGQMMTFLWRAAGCPEPASAGMPFQDVDPAAYNAKAIVWAVEQGITQGVTATAFRPNATVTRQQTVTFLWRAAGSPDAGRADFRDIPDNAYFAPAVAWATSKHITNGTTADTFSPGAPCTRGQIVTFLYRSTQA